jgi:hypothetical protein
VVEFFFRASLAGCALSKHSLDRLEKRHIVADAQCIGMRHREREGLRKFAHGPNASILSVLLRQDVFLHRRKQAQPFLRRPGRPFRPV